MRFSGRVSHFTFKMRGMPRRLFAVDMLPWGIFALLGTFFVLLGVAFAVPTLQQLASYASATGSVIDYSRDGEMAYPVVEFETPDGRQWSFQEGWGSDPPAFRLEQKVDVRYDPANPRRAFINSFVGLWIFPGIFFLVGGVFALIGWVGVFSVFRHQRMSR